LFTPTGGPLANGTHVPAASDIFAIKNPLKAIKSPNRLEQYAGVKVLILMLVV
jgi:hypothetical protein